MTSSTSRVWLVLTLFSVSILVSCDSGGGTPGSEEPSEVAVDVTGTVTSAEGNEPIEGASVNVLRADNGNTLASATTATSGSYEATFTIKESETPDQLQLEAYAKGFMDAEVLADFQPSVSKNVTLEAMSGEASASGKVTEEGSSDPIEGTTVTGTRADNGEKLFETTTASDGTYETDFQVSEEPDEVVLKVDADNYGSEETSVSFSVTIEVDFDLTPEIEISTLEELQQIGNEPGYPLDQNYVLVNDIDANGASGLEPIGSDIAQFSGVFRGNGFVIKGLDISQPGKENVGLFSVLSEEGAIQNIALEGVNIEGDTNTGALVGKNRGEIVECVVSGTVEGNFRTGGLVGWNRNAQVRSSMADVSVSGSSETGGLVGSNFSVGAEIVSSSSTGTVSGSQDVGGLSGLSFVGVIENSYSDSDVEATENDVGGLVGSMRRGGEVISSFSTGDVSGNKNVGGLIGNGDADDREAIVKNVYSTSSVSGEINSGGLMGVSQGPMQVSNSFASGSVSGADNVGGVIGTNGATLEVSFWDTQATGQDNGIGQGNFEGAVGLTTSEMQGNSAKENMGSFDFQNTWETVMSGYPVLQ